MEKTVRLSSEQREDLVAYLDGELPDEQVQQIDRVIARSEVARHEVEALARAWEMLDVLPEVPASEDFATKTLTTLQAMERPFILSEQWYYVYITRAVMLSAWLIALSISGWLGFQITRYWVPNPNDELIRDLPVIENLHHYQDAGDIEFLRELKRQGLFDETPGLRFLALHSLSLPQISSHGNLIADFLKLNKPLDEKFLPTSHSE